MNSEQLPNKYLKKLLIPGLVALIFEVCALFLDNSFALIWLANAFLIMYSIWLLVLDQETPIKSCFWIGFGLFLLIDLIVAFAKLVIFWKFWYFLNLLTEPLIYAIIGGGLVWLGSLLGRKLYKPKPATDSKTEVNN